ncbi:hypothetical protein M408DRAFT_292223 [Serendipita vermifera MAFF 305830]|uniref:NB-ARC domain-containing protein n=1 Tax=Serendipita vermifera MAFF 305830 TaxID=933852 RepID=A0A0C3ASJ0_SERVB|nr:hypothetical protein M408DRAFT_292223 [Serendipita vermifera MAFF 305830]
MHVEEAIGALLTVASSVFPPDEDHQSSPEENQRKLIQCLNKILRERGFSVDTKLYDKASPPVKCKVLIYAAASANLEQARAFRSYASRGLKIDATIVEAVCATMATPSFFPPFTIGPEKRKEAFVGAPLGANNPIQELLKEAEAVFGRDGRVSLILSLGLSGSLTISTNPPGFTKQALGTVKALAADCERVAKELSSRLCNVDAHLRISVNFEQDDAKLDDWSIITSIESEANRYLATQSGSATVDACLRLLQERIGTVTLQRINSVNAAKTNCKSVPEVSPYFVIRSKVWGPMVDHLIESTLPLRKILAITGMGGCGKTQMVSYFIEQYHDLYTHVVYVDAGSLSTIKANLQDWVRSLGGGHEQDVWEEALLFLAQGPHDGKWVLILDNADNPDIDMGPFLPQCSSGTILITSRNRNVGNELATLELELGEMEPDEAMSALLKASRRQPPLPQEELNDAQTLVKELGSLALALVLAGTYCYQRSSAQNGVLQEFTFTEYLEALRTSGMLPLMDQQEPSGLDSYQRGVYTTLNLSYAMLPEAAQKLLHLLSCFYHSGICLAIFSIAARRNFVDPLKIVNRPDQHEEIITNLKNILHHEGVWNDQAIQETIRTLRSFSLVSVGTISNTLFLHLHPLVHHWVQDSLKLQMRDLNRSMSVQIVTAVTRISDPRVYQYFLPHIIHIHENINTQDLHVIDQIVHAGILADQGRYRLAISLLRKALSSLEETLGPDHRDSIFVANNLAASYNDDGHYDEAEKLRLEILRRRRASLGFEHPDTIRAMANLASTYHSQARLRDAEALNLEVLELRMRILGMNDPDTIASMNNLAFNYNSQGRWNDAEPLQSDVLAWNLEKHGPSHHGTISAAINMSRTYASQARWEGATNLQTTALQYSKDVHGLDHPQTIITMETLASTLSSQGRLSEAENVASDVVKTRERIYGRGHHTTVNAVHILASIYSSQEKWPEAEELFLEVLQRKIENTGGDHTKDMVVENDLARVYASQGRLDEAAKLRVRVLEHARSKLGMDHPNTMIAESNLASDYSSQGRHLDAEKLLHSLLKRQQRLLGKDHPITLTTENNLALSLLGQKKLARAEAIFSPIAEEV